MHMSYDTQQAMDRIDKVILSELAANPRTPYGDIATALETHDIEMSAEGVRRRVNRLLERTDPFFLLSPNQHDWNLVRFAITATQDAESKDVLMKTLSEMDFWFVSRGFGTCDFYAVATTATNDALDELIAEVRGIPEVAHTDYTVETQRRVDINEYFISER